jgi:hypothetical protein
MILDFGWAHVAAGHGPARLYIKAARHQTKKKRLMAVAYRRTKTGHWWQMSRCGSSARFGAGGTNDQWGAF